MGDQSWRWAGLCEFRGLRTEAQACWLGAGQAAAQQEGPDGLGQSGCFLCSWVVWVLFTAADFLGFRFLPGWIGH